jgi:hypothetical protein
MRNPVGDKNEIVANIRAFETKKTLCAGSRVSEASPLCYPKAAQIRQAGRYFGAGEASGSLFFALKCGSFDLAPSCHRTDSAFGGSNKVPEDRNLARP